MPTNAMVGMEATPGTLIATKGSPRGWETAVRGQQRRGGSRGEGAAEAGVSGGGGQRRRGAAEAGGSGGGGQQRRAPPPPCNLRPLRLDAEEGGGGGVGCAATPAAPAPPCPRPQATSHLGGAQRRRFAVS